MASFVFGLQIGLALAFALSLTMLVTMLRLRIRMARFNARVAGESIVRVPKGRSAPAVVHVGLTGGLSAEALRVRAPLGVDAKVESLEGGDLRLSVKPRYSGLFLGLEAAYGIKDEMGFFLAERSLRLEDFRVESIPLNLVVDVGAPVLSPTGLDENPAGVRGHGQEIYAIEEAPQAEARSVYWRGVAKSSEGTIVALVREAGLPDRVTVGIIAPPLLEVERLRWMDLVSEALAKLGRMLLRWNISVEINSSSKRGLSRVVAASTLELSHGIMKIWEEPQVPGREAELIRRSDIVLAEPATLSSAAVAPLLLGKPALVLPLGGTANVTRAANNFRIEEVDDLIAEVVG